MRRRCAGGRNLADGHRDALDELALEHCVSQADPPCSVAGIATTLDATTSRLGAAADHAYAAALTQEANAATENLDESVRDSGWLATFCEPPK